MDRTGTYDIRQLRGRPTLLAAHCPSRMAVLLVVAASAACCDRSAPADKSSGTHTVERPSHPTTPSVSTTVTGKATPTQTVKWLEKVAEIVMDPNAKKPMKVTPYPPNRSVTYSFRVDGLDRVEVEVFDADRRRWILTISGAEVTPETLAAGAATVICKKTTRVEEIVWYRFDAGPLKGAFAIPQAAGGAPTIVVSSREAMDADKANAESKGVAETPSIEEFIRLGC